MKRKVRVTGPGVKLNNIWCYINEEAVIDEKQYDRLLKSGLLAKEFNK